MYLYSHLEKEKDFIQEFIKNYDDIEHEEIKNIYYHIAVNSIMFSLVVYGN